ASADHAFRQAADLLERLEILRHALADAAQCLIGEDPPARLVGPDRELFAPTCEQLCGCALLGLESIETAKAAPSLLRIDPECICALELRRFLLEPAEPACLLERGAQVEIEPREVAHVVGGILELVRAQGTAAPVCTRVPFR